jgi:hypothetical protein
VGEGGEGEEGGEKRKKGYISLYLRNKTLRSNLASRIICHQHLEINVVRLMCRYILTIKKKLRRKDRSKKNNK